MENTRIDYIPKNIHISWKTKDILESNSRFIENCIGNLVRLSEGWNPIIYDDADLEEYLKENLDSKDYNLLKDRHIVEKCDVWRLIKMYNEGGLYVDIDRLCNISLNQIIPDGFKMVLPTWQDGDFSQDIMCSAPNNPIFLEALKLNLERRYAGVTSIYDLGPVTYFHAVTKMLVGRFVEFSPGQKIMDDLRTIINSSGFITTYRENSIYDSFLFRPEISKIDFDHESEKRMFYRESEIKHWTGSW